MNVSIRFHNLQPSDALREHAERRVQFSMSRFGEEIVEVVVRLRDLNGPKGGLDKRCQVTVFNRRFPALVTEHVSDDAYAAVDLAVERASRGLGREVQRVRAERALARPSHRRLLELLGGGS